MNPVAPNRLNEPVAPEPVELSRSHRSRSNLSRSHPSRSNLSRSSPSRSNLSRSNLSRSNLSRSHPSRSHPNRWTSWPVARSPGGTPRPEGSGRRPGPPIERVVELLRPRAHADLAEFGPQLYDALVELSSARLRGGDIWGSRAPAKEAKALAKTLGR